MREALLSVGIDVGTTTSQLVFSRLSVENQANAFSVPHFSITQRDILYRSPIHFTPLLSDTRIDAEALGRIVKGEFAAAGISHVDTGAVIITGETARKENAKEVLHALSGLAGEFVVATAGPALESALAGKGAGAADYSRRHHCEVLNLDIGGGTTNFALFANGELKDTGCLNVGGRLMKFEKGRCSYLSPVLQPFFDKTAEPRKVADFLVGILEEALGLRPTQYLSHFVTDKLCKPTPLLSFSGGVADLIDDTPRDPFAYGDLGVLLGKAIFHSRLKSTIPAAETIRATVLGAGLHSTELSGSTIFYRNLSFPLKNLPVATLTEAEEALPSETLSTLIGQKLDALCEKNEACVLAFKGMENPGFSELCKLADVLAIAFSHRSMILLCLQRDMGKALGQALALRLPNTPLLCLDGLHLPEHSYLDIAAPIAGGQVLPVIIKTLIL